MTASGLRAEARTGLPEPAARRLLRQPAVRIAAIYLASRVVTTAFFLLAAGLSPPGSRFGHGADLATYAVAWDAQHYQRIADE
ncbi:hypothetical protein B1729_20290, partial [Microbacterium sp. B35-04]